MATATSTSTSRLRVGKGVLSATLGVAAFCTPYVVMVAPQQTSTFTSTSTSTSTSTTFGTGGTGGGGGGGGLGGLGGWFPGVSVAHAAEASSPSSSASLSSSGVAPAPAPAAGNHPKTTVRELTPRLRDFLQWLDGVKVECAKRGVSDKTIAAAFSGIEPLPEVVVSQTSGSQPEVKFTVERYLKNIVTRDRIEMGAARLIKHAALLREVEREYGVPAEILVSIWGIESSFGGFTGDMDSIQALATLVRR